MDKVSLLTAFADELSAHRYLEQVLWPNGPVCPHCDTRGRIGKLDGASTRIGARKCYACRKIFSITDGTIFRRSHVPLHKWLQVIYLTEGRTTALRPFHLARIIDVTCKTAISMLRRLEKADCHDFSLATRTQERRPLPPQGPALRAVDRSRTTGAGSSVRPRSQLDQASSAALRSAS